MGLSVLSVLTPAPAESIDMLTLPDPFSDESYKSLTFFVNIVISHSWDSSLLIPPFDL